MLPNTKSLALIQSHSTVHKAGYPGTKSAVGKIRTRSAPSLPC